MNFRRKFALALISGALAGAGHAPFDLWPVALVGFLGVIWLVSGTASGRQSALLGWVAGVGYFATTLHWIVQPFLVDIARHGWMAPFALILIAAGLGVFWGVAGWISARCHPRALGFALALALAEMARGYVLTGFPWALPAYIWTETPVRMTASLVGPFGLTALTLVLLAFPMATPRKGLAALGVAILLTALWFWGNTRIGPDSETLGIARIVQPNAPQHEKWDPEKAHTFVDRQIAFTGEPKDRVDLVVWPETAIPYRLDTAAPVLSRIATAANGPTVVLGVNRTEAGLHHNALITLPETGLVAETYDKVHLVPFGEYIPFGQVARLVGLRSFAARDGYGFSPGAGVRLIETPLGRALPLICYEAIFPQQIHAAPARPDYLLQITNDAWFGTFSGPFQHLQQAQFRAVEQGLALVRSANTGVSAVIGPDGRVLNSLALGQAGFLDVPVPAPRGVTVYARLGDAPFAMFILLTLVAFIWSGRRNAIANRTTTS